MKTRLSFLFIVLFVSISVFSQIKMNSAGKVAIGGISINSGYNLSVEKFARFDNAPNSSLVIDQSAYYALAFYPSTNNSGNIGRSDRAFKEIYSYNYYDLNSDLKQKENVRNLTNSLSIIKKLRGIKYDLKNSVAVDTAIKDSNAIAILDRERKNRIGFIGQEMINYLPEAVHYVDSTDVYAIDYSRVTVILVEAMKEQQDQIDSLKNIISKTKSTLKSAFIQTNVISSEPKIASLSQNVPNPYRESTTISYYLPETVTKAMINIYDMNGGQIKTIPIQNKGNSSITIQGSELHPGLFFYTLIADGVEIDTKKMILTE